MQIVRTCAGACATLLALCASVSAQNVNFSGFYAGIHGGISFGKTDLEVTGSPLAVNGLGSDGAVGGFHLGYDHQMGNIVVGVLGEWNPLGNTKFEIAPGLLSYELGDSWMVAGRLGVVVGTALPYVFAGYTSTEADLSSLGTSIDSHRLTGPTFGGGVDLMVMDSFMLGARYAYTKYDGEDLLGLGFINLDTEQHKAEVRASYKLTFDRPTLK